MAKQELLETIRDRYQAASRKEKSRIFDEFIAVTGHHRKHSIRLLGRPVGGEDQGHRSEVGVYPLGSELTYTTPSLGVEPYAKDVAALAWHRRKPWPSGYPGRTPRSRRYRHDCKAEPSVGSIQLRAGGRVQGEDVPSFRCAVYHAIGDEGRGADETRRFVGPENNPWPRPRHEEGRARGSTRRLPPAPGSPVPDTARSRRSR